MAPTKNMEHVNFNDGACYLSLDGDNKHLLGVSYGNGRLNVYPLDERGRPDKAITTVDEGKREAHCVLVSPDNQNLYIPYVKEILPYCSTNTTAIPEKLNPRMQNPRHGTGPRHMAYHPKLPMVYFSNEQGIGLSTYRRDKDGQLKVEQDIVYSSSRNV